MNQSILNELSDGIVGIMESHILRIILYGSVANETDTEDSDVDVALLVKNTLTSEIEDSLSDFVVDMNLKYDMVFSVIDIDFDTYCKWLDAIPFYQNVDKGIVLWSAK